MAILLNLVKVGLNCDISQMAMIEVPSSKTKCYKYPSSITLEATDLGRGPGTLTPPPQAVTPMGSRMSTWWPLDHRLRG